MEKENNILDKIIQNKQVEQLTQFNPIEIISYLFKNLNSREKEVLKSRYGLDGGKKQTLEKIGNTFKVTRERVRQIERNSINRLKELGEHDSQIKSVENLVAKTLEQNGGIMEQNHLLENVLVFPGESQINRASLIFIISQLLADKFVILDAHEHFLPSWKLKFADEKLQVDLINQLVDLVKEKNEPLTENQLLDILKENDLVREKQTNNQVITACLRLSKNLKQDIFGKWGIANWSLVTPKRINDKIYIVLKNSDKPMHFTEISRLINEMKFDKKTAYPATVHNELILDDKYVLVGRGIYALAEWGYKPGVVSDVIENILIKEGRSLTREEIVQKVLEQRMVGKSTVHLALMNKEKFRRNPSGLYELIKGPEATTV